jgi:hypothetical protein
MSKKPIKQRRHKAEIVAAKKPTQKGALAEALSHVGPHATHSALARFARERFGMALALCILVPRSGACKKPDARSVPWARSA